MSWRPGWLGGAEECFTPKRFHSILWPGHDPCAPGEACGTSSAKKTDDEQKHAKLRQYILFGAVILIFLLRWFNLVNTIFGVDAALIAILIGAAPVYSRALNALIRKQLTTDVLISIAITAALGVPGVHSVNASWLGPFLNRSAALAAEHISDERKPP